MKNHEQATTRLQERETQLAEAKYREQGTTDELYEARTRMRQLESEVSKLHEHKLTSDNRAIERLGAMQSKHEEVLGKLAA